MADQPSTFTIDDADAPFVVKATVRWQQGQPLLGLTTTPWAIVLVDGVGRGKTPLNQVELVVGKKHRLVLRNPAGAAMELTVVVAALAPGPSPGGP
jgi:hypothetical protein